MNLHQIEMALAYSSLGLYSIGVLCFLIFALTLLHTSLKHFICGLLLSPVWPIFIAVALIRGNKASATTIK